MDPHPLLPLPVASEQAARDVAPEIQVSDQLLAGLIEEPGDAPAAICGQHADVGP